MNTNSDFFEWLARVWVDYRPVFNVVFVLVGALVLRAILLHSVKRVVVSVTSGVDAKTKPEADDSPLAKAMLGKRLDDGQQGFGFVAIHCASPVMINTQASFIPNARALCSVRYRTSR